MSVRQRNSAVSFYEDRNDDVDRFSYTQPYGLRVQKIFTRKVYAIVCCQMIFIGLLSWFFISYPLPSKWMKQPQVVDDEIRLKLICIKAVLTFTIALLLRCCEGSRRSFPLNVIYLAAFTLTLGLLLGALSSVYFTKAIIMAVGVAAAMFLALTLLTFLTRWNFTIWGDLVVCISVGLMVFGGYSFYIINLTLLYASVAALLVSAVFVFDTWLMLNGRHVCQVFPEDCTFVALTLSLDIITFFLYVPRILRKCCYRNRT